MLKIERFSFNGKINRLTGRLNMLVVTCLVLVCFAVTVHADSEGIKIHGSWTVIVTNPDGSVAQELMFENALDGEGKAMLNSLLTGRNRVAERPDGSPGWNLHAVTTGLTLPGQCVEHPQNDQDASEISQGNATLTKIDFFTFKLSRDFAVPADCVVGASYAVTDVFSMLSISSTELNGSSKLGVFSSKTLPAPIADIQPDQSVSLNVTFSFE